MTTSLSTGGSRALATASGIEFGVACLHFAYRRPGPYTLHGDDFLSELESTLAGVPGVSKLVVDGDDDDIEVGAGPVPSLGEGEALPDHPGLTAHPDYLFAEFDLHVPSDVQEKTIGQVMRLMVGTEDFHVFVGYTRYMPVTYVRLVEPTGRPPLPSLAVRFVRDYLAQEIAKRDTHFRLEVLGPSPFPADFFVEPQNGLHAVDGRSLRVEQTRSRGNPTITAYFDPALFASANDAFTELRSQMEDELGVYYDLRRVELEAICEWERLRNIAVDLVHAHPQRGRLARAKDWMGRGRRIRSLVTSIVEYETERIFQRNAMEHNVRNSYERVTDPLLREHVEDAARDLWPYPTEQLGRLAAYLAEQRGKTIEMLVVLLASVIGGIAGAAITLLVS